VTKPKAAKKAKKKTSSAPRGRGRPVEYKAEFCEKACEYAARGATDREIAEMLGVHEATLYRWKHTYPEFCEALKLGKEVPDGRVVQSLYRRAIGYSFDSVKIFMPAGAKKPVIVPIVEHVPPDTNAAKLWLTNRDPDNWREKVEVDHGASRDLIALLKERRERAAKEG